MGAFNPHLRHQIAWQVGIPVLACCIGFGHRHTWYSYRPSALQEIFWVVAVWLLDLCCWTSRSWSSFLFSKGTHPDKMEEPPFISMWGRGNFMADWFLCRFKGKRSFLSKAYLYDMKLIPPLIWLSFPFFFSCDCSLLSCIGMEDKDIHAFILANI